MIMQISTAIRRGLELDRPTTKFTELDIELKQLTLGLRRDWKPFLIDPQGLC